MKRLICGLGFALCLAACSAPSAPPHTATAFTGTPRPVIIDTDMAIDDLMALLFVLQRQDLDVLAITVTGAGEAHCEPGVRHAQGLAVLAGRPDVAVTCGREAPLRGDHVFPSDWRERVDALAGLSLPAPASELSALPAPELIVALAEAAPEPIILLTLGPLTNVAEALQTSPELADQLAMVYLMGGAVDVPGNVAVPGSNAMDNPHAEWNLYVDPYAANWVLQSGAPVTLVPLDATNQAPMTLDFLQRLAANRSTPEAQFVSDLLAKQRDFIASGGYFFWDPLTAAILADESLATFRTQRLAVVDAEGSESGRVVTAEAGPAVRVAIGVDTARFEALFLETLNATWP